jgi:L-amino acid N-acyltransferase YncA
MTTIALMTSAHANEVLQIYEQGIKTGLATFETVVPTWTAFSEKYFQHSRFVAIEDGKVVGWAVLSPVSSRACYAGVAEVSVYVHANEKRKGLGTRLLEELILSSEKNGIWSLLSVIDDGNGASIHLHEKCGFRIIGYRTKIARLNGEWRTTVMMEKRSTIIGT